jgi:hypothetical protein
VSDRAKALIKLAHTGLGCPSIPDLFHLGHDLAKGYSLCIFGRLRQAKRDLEQAKQRLEKLQKSAQADPAQIAQAQTRVAACATSVNHWQEVGSAWRQRLSNLSRILHPWRLVDSIRQTSKEVEEQLRAELLAIETLLETNGLPMKKEASIMASATPFYFCARQKHLTIGRTRGLSTLVIILSGRKWPTR